MDPATLGLLSVGGLISGIVGSKDSPQEAEIRKLLDRLYGEMDWLKQSPFSKDELFNTIMPSIQQTYRGSANVAAGQIGATVGESGLPMGQTFMDYYTQALAPIIAEGEQAAGNTYQNFVNMWSQMDSNTKARVLGAYQLMLGGAQELPDMTSEQKFLTSFLKGADITAGIKGNIDMAGALTDQANSLKSISKYFMNDNFKEIQDIYKDIFKKDLGGAYSGITEQG